MVRGFGFAVLAAVCGASAAGAADCPREAFADVGGKPIWKAKGALAFKSGLMIDADGAPNAYGPDGKGKNGSSGPWGSL